MGLSKVICDIGQKRREAHLVKREARKVPKVKKIINWWGKPLLTN